MSRIHPLTAEDRRILTAAAENRLLKNEHGRYVIVGEARPDRKRRESLSKKGLIVYTLEPKGWVATERGRDRLASEPAS